MHDSLKVLIIYEMSVISDDFLHYKFAYASTSALINTIQPLYYITHTSNVKTYVL